MGGYVYISNGSKPNEEQNNRRDPVVLGNMSAPYIEAALKLGYEVYLGLNRDNPEQLECTYPVHLFDSHTYRSIIAFHDNKIAYQNLSRIVCDGNVEVIHCNTPVGGMIGRLVGRRYHVKKVIYTAHGFHFYKGAPLFNRTFLKWAEQLMAHWTDAIITMNEEDYQAALKFTLRKGGKVYKVHGVGITLDDFRNIEVDRIKKREELGLRNTDIALISVGELNNNKNNSVIIEALAAVKNINIHYFLCGAGNLEQKLRDLVKEKNVESQVHFLGYRTDIKELLTAVDIFVMPSYREGLSRSLMEAMASGLPCIASKIRGNVDLLDEEKGGYLRCPDDVDGFANGLMRLSENENLRREMGQYNLNKIKNYDISVVKEEIEEIYKEVLR